MPFRRRRALPRNLKRSFRRRLPGLSALLPGGRFRTENASRLLRPLAPPRTAGFRSVQVGGWHGVGRLAGPDEVLQFGNLGSTLGISLGRKYSELKKVTCYFFKKCSLRFLVPLNLRSLLLSKRFSK
jgi:hypothetical protein